MSKKNKLKFKKYDQVIIRWFDAVFDSGGWEKKSSLNFENHEEATKCASMGFFLYKAKKNIYICQSCGEYALGGIFSIPIGCIRSIKKLKAPSKIKRRKSAA